MEEAYDELDVGPTQMANLRRQALQGALDALVKKPGGRPRSEAVVSEEEVAALRLRNAALERELAEMRARVELAILPFLGKRPGGKRSRGNEPPSGTT